LYAQRSYWKIFLYVVLGTAIIGAVTTSALFYYIIENLPSYEHLKMYDPPVTSRIYSGDGVLFAEYAKERRVFSPIDEIPDQVIQAFIAVEDHEFYHHHGIHIPSIISAFIGNLRTHFSKKSGRSRGGSTITQQVAKNFLLTKERTYIRKLREAILAWKIEGTLTKKRILELYLNEIYLGAGTYGVASASLLYFDKALEDLELHEIAFLACLPKAPQNYHPSRHPQAALERRNWVITRMLEEKMITEAEAMHALSQPLGARTQRTPLTIDANYFAEHVRQQLTERYQSDGFYEGGWYIRTSLDAKLQKLADRVLHDGIRHHDKTLGFRGPIARIPTENWTHHIASLPLPQGLYEQTIAVVTDITNEHATIGLRDGSTGIIPFQHMAWARRFTIDPHKKTPMPGPAVSKPADIVSIGDVIIVSPVQDSTYSLEQIPELNGALVAIDPHSGRVLAFDGGYRFTRSQFNRATQAVRQVGSTFKPFVYLAALEAGYSPSSVLLDAPIVLGNWRPQNITGKFYGRLTLRRALERSVNLAPLRLATHIGLPRIRELAKRLNIYDNMPLELTTILGAEETTLLRLTAAFAMLANGGKFIDPIFIDRVQDRYGNTVLSRTPVSLNRPQEDAPWSDQISPTPVDNRRQVISEPHAYQVISMLEGVVSRGSGRRAHIPNVSIAGKTGTSNDNRDALFIGCTNQIVVGVYVGFDQPQSLGDQHTGGRVAGPIFKAFMQEYLKTHKAGPFPTPTNVDLVSIDLESGTLKNSERMILEASPNSSNDSSNSDDSDSTEGIY